MVKKDNEIKNAQIEKTALGFHDGFGSIKTAWITLNYGGSGQGFGGRSLGEKATDAFVYGVLNALECESWESLKGMHCRAIIEDELVVGIGHILKDKWFVAREMMTQKDKPLTKGDIDALATKDWKR